MSGIWGEDTTKDIWGRPKPKVQRPKIMYYKPKQHKQSTVPFVINIGTRTRQNHQKFKSEKQHKQNEFQQIGKYIKEGRRIFMPNMEERIQAIRERNKAIARQEAGQIVYGQEKKEYQELRERQKVNNPTVQDRIAKKAQEIRENIRKNILKKGIYD